MYVTESSRGFLFRLVISLLVFIFPSVPSLWKGIFLIFASDFLDDIFFRKYYSATKSTINSSYSYQLTDKINDAITNFFGLMLLDDIITDLSIIYLALLWRVIGIAVFTQIKSSWIWVIFPDLTKELLIARLIFGQITVPILIIVYGLKSLYEFYHHFMHNIRTFDKICV